LALLTSVSNRIAEITPFYGALDTARCTSLRA
jgi:hypothetical protein